MSEKGSNPHLEGFLARVTDLPSVPAMASRVMQVVEDPTAGAEDLRRVIDGDPALAARILKVANSSLYSFARRIETLRHAIALLGFRTVGNIVLAASLREVFAHFGLAEKLLWEHATLTGVVASRLAVYPGVGVERESAFTAGLLHDLGKVAMNNHARDRYTEVFGRVYNDGLAFVDAEREVFGFDHAELGARVVAKWRLPANLECAIRHHHAPEMLAQLPEPERRLTALTSVATRCCTRLGVGRRAPVEGLILSDHAAWGTLDLDESDVEPVLACVERELKRNQGQFR